MGRFLAIALVPLLLPGLLGCNSIRMMIEGQNSDRAHGGGYCRVPQRDGEGKLSVPERDWSAGPERVW